MDNTKLSHIRLCHFIFPVLRDSDIQGVKYKLFSFVLLGLVRRNALCIFHYVCLLVRRDALCTYVLHMSLCEEGCFVHLPMCYLGLLLLELRCHRLWSFLLCCFLFLSIWWEFPIYVLNYFFFCYIYNKYFSVISSLIYLLFKNLFFSITHACVCLCVGIWTSVWSPRKEGWILWSSP